MILKISASAGSGKTYTLTRLFLDLLEKADPCADASGCALSRHGHAYSLAEILAATFTNKAAAEMKSRVVVALKEKALQERARLALADPAARSLSSRPAGRAEEWVERILRHYGSLNIRTIDSLLVTLVRLSALELGLPPDFSPSFDEAEYYTPVHDALMEDLARHGAGYGTVAEDGYADAVLLPSAQTLPEAGEPGDGMLAAPLFLSGDAAALRNALSLACASLLYFKEFRGFTPGGRLHDMILELVTRLLAGREVPDMDSAAVHSRLRFVHGALVAAAEDLLGVLGSEQLQGNAHFLRYVGQCARWSPYVPLPKSSYARKRELDECLNKASRGAGSARAEAAFSAFIRAAEAFSASLPVLRHALQLAPLVPPAREIYARMRAGGRQDQLLPAVRLPLLAGRVLAGEYGVSDALCRLGTRLSRLLLDEFQDTSLEQWEAIQPLAVESLSRGGCLIYVGDVKQAIYGWRGGDARLFHAVPDDPELKAIAPSAQERQLQYNWRSHPVIVAHNNAFFGLLARRDIALETLTAMLPEETPREWLEKAAEDVLACFARNGQKVPPGKNWDADPGSKRAAVCLYRVSGENAEDVETLIRERLRALLLEELLPAWSFGDIALLVRSNTEAGLLAKWLTEWGLPVVTENSFLLASHPLVCRLVSFLAFLDYPLDDLAFWEAISGPGRFIPALSPGSGQTEVPLPGPDWLARKSLEHGKARPPLYRMFRAEYPEAWSAWIAPFYNEAGLMSAYDTLREIVRRFHLLRRVPGQAAFLLRLLEVAHLAETRGHSSLAAFLAFWKGCKDSEKLPLPENMDAVRIMTMHKAKGLEFPVVVLPFQHKGDTWQGELAVVEHQGLRLLTRVCGALPELYYPARIRNELERLNLLYVSWTRPVYALHAFIARPQKAGAMARGLEILLERYRREAPAEGYGWEEIGAESLRRAASSSLARESGASRKRADGEAPPEGPAEADFPDSWRPMDWLPRLRIYRSPLEGAKLSPKRRGILAHLCLEQLVLSPADEAAGPRQALIRRDVQRAVRQGMRLFPMPVDNPEAAALEMEECLFWFAGLPEAPFWLARGRREQGIADSRGAMHRVDLLVDEAAHAHDAAAFLHALDYKTGLYPDGKGVEEHHKQMRRYLGLLKKAFGRPVRGTLVYLDERRLAAIAWEEQ